MEVPVKVWRKRLALGVFRIRIPDSERANRATAFYNIIYGFLVGARRGKDQH